MKRSCINDDLSKNILISNDNHYQQKRLFVNKRDIILDGEKPCLTIKHNNSNSSQVPGALPPL
jgi:hypothetical protein